MSIKYFCFLILLCSCALAAEKDIVVIGEDNWTDLLHGEWMIEFHAPWCPACKTLQPVWEDLASWDDDLGIKVAKVDVTKSPALSGRFMVTTLPTIFHAFDGEFRQYKGPRGKEDFISFIEEKKWKDVETIPAWKAPDSIWMTLVAWFFKVSMFLRGLYVYLTEDFGIPYWAGYGIFALLTIIVGAVLGLVIVFFIDFFYPPKQEQKKKVKSDDSKSDDDSKENTDDADAAVAEDLIDEAAEKEVTKSESGPESAAEETGSPRSLRKRKTRKD